MTNEELKAFAAMSSENRIIRFNKFLRAEQINIINQLVKNGMEDILRDILEQLYLSDIKDLLNKCSKEEKKIIYSNLSPAVLRELYNAASKEEKVQMAQMLDEIQLGLNDQISSERESIDAQMSQIAEANTRIGELENDIAQNKQNISNKEQELKAQKVVLKKLDKERAKALKQLLRAQKKRPLQNKANRVGIIAKYRTKKYEQKLANFLAKSDAVRDQRANNAAIQQEIYDLKSAIEEDKRHISIEQANINYAKKTIDASVKKIGDTEVKIRQISKGEKRILGRKLYNQTVHQRDCVMVRKKSTKKDRADNSRVVHQSEVVESPKHETTANIVTNQLANISALQQLGVNFFAPTMPLNGIQAPDLLNISQAATLNSQQIVILNMVMLAKLAELNRQMQMQQAAQGYRQGYSRSLKPSGNVSIMLLASIIFFIIGLLLFILR